MRCLQQILHEQTPLTYSEASELRRIFGSLNPLADTMCTPLDEIAVVGFYVPPKVRIEDTLYDRSLRFAYKEREPTEEEIRSATEEWHESYCLCKDIREVLSDIPGLDNKQLLGAIKTLYAIAHADNSYK